ncbi:deoxyhypusine synthase family protein [candidate division KSB1 bacterium]|nr:deoxyhypusine synthase family protein [candidate division KSB1 bacterium]
MDLTEKADSTMEIKKSLFQDAPDINPVKLKKNMNIVDLIDVMGQLPFEARNLHHGAKLFQHMIHAGDTIWLGIAGAGIAGGMGGMVISLIEAGFVDVICSTGAQVYHDLHFAFGLPVKSINPRMNDDLLRKHGDTRIYDIGIREKETLEAQDELIQQFVKDRYKQLSGAHLSSWEFIQQLGLWTAENAKSPEKSFVAAAAQKGVPVFWDSLSNHSIAMNLTLTDRLGYPVVLSAQKDIFDSAAIVFSSPQTGFVELGGGGPKNFIQQTSPTIHQILGIEFNGADRGLQIGTAIEREGSLSGCTFGEGVTWGKYKNDSIEKLVQIWGEYSIVFPLLTAYVLETCPRRGLKNVAGQMPNLIQKLAQAK